MLPVNWTSLIVCLWENGKHLCQSLTEFGSFSEKDREEGKEVGAGGGGGGGSRRGKNVANQVEEQRSERRKTKLNLWEAGTRLWYISTSTTLPPPLWRFHSLSSITLKGCEAVWRGMRESLSSL